MPLDPKKGQSLGKYTVDFKNGKISFDAPVSKKSPFDGRAAAGLGGEANPALLKKMKNLYMDTLGSDIGVGPQVMGMVSGGGVKRPVPNEANVATMRKWLGDLVNKGESYYDIANEYLRLKYPKLFAKAPPHRMVDMITDELGGEHFEDVGRYNYGDKDIQILDVEGGRNPFKELMLLRNLDSPDYYTNTFAHEKFGHSVIGHQRKDARMLQKEMENLPDGLKWLLDNLRGTREYAILEAGQSTPAEKEKVAYKVGETAQQTFKLFLQRVADQAEKYGDPNTPMFRRWAATRYPR